MTKKFFIAPIILALTVFGAVFIEGISSARAEIKTYTGVGEDYASEFETQDTAKKRAVEKAIQDAKEQAGVYLVSYSRVSNFNLAEDEISTITSNAAKVVGAIKYESLQNKLTNGITMTLWRATLNVAIDDAEIINWQNESKDFRLNLINQTREAQRAASESDKEVMALRNLLFELKRAEDGVKLKEQFKNTDKVFLANQKIREGDSLYYAKNYKSAVARYNEALKLNPNNVSAYNNRGVCYRQLNDYRKAFTDFEIAIELNPKYANAYYNRGLCYQLLGSNAQAQADFAQAIKLGFRI